MGSVEPMLLWIRTQLIHQTIAACNAVPQS